MCKPSTTAMKISFNNDPDNTFSRILKEISPIAQKFVNEHIKLTSEEHINARKWAAEKIVKKQKTEEAEKIKKKKEE